jgi:hypothetical protein
VDAAPEQIKDFEKDFAPIISIAHKNGLRVMSINPTTIGST